MDYFKSKLNRLKEGETGTKETRNFWISPLLTNLGFNLSFNRQAEELNSNPNILKIVSQNLPCNLPNKNKKTLKGSTINDFINN